MPRKKAEGEPRSVSFKSAKGEVSFTARSRKKNLPDPEPVLEKEEEETPQVRQPRRQQSVPKAPETPGMYDAIHEHLNTRAERHSQRWGEFLIS